MRTFASGWSQRHPHSRDLYPRRPQQIPPRCRSAHNTPLFKLRVPTVAVDGAGNFVVAWFIGANSIWARQFDAAGRARGLSFRVSTVGEDVDRPQIAASPNGNFAIAWETGDASYSDTGVYLRTYTAAGRATMTPKRVDSRLLRFPEIVFVSDERLVVAAHGNGIYAQCWSSSGAALGSAVRADTVATPFTALMASVGRYAGGLVLAWQDFSASSGRDVYARLFSSC